MLTIPGEDALILTAHRALVVQWRVGLDRVFIEGLEVDTVIGAYDWERGIRQCLRLDLSFAWDNRPAAAEDDLSKALDYASVSARIQAFAEQAQFQLVETFAERLAEVLMSEFHIPWLRLKLTKPGAVAAASGVGVEIERGCR
ncbi:Dihydroneopterin aldolase [Pseudomonas syringae pv. philadelphi]|uniref:7,8-dihydroneopterin aldolase n=1 Tax=Pseudomonas syringae pv. philadelphi TaxID=251706 RepID=A0A3M3ZMW2_9PSED|nr:Dihydroneopterin aldolase [Pseudomonas syringae pv. philadelphi]